MSPVRLVAGQGQGGVWVVGGVWAGGKGRGGARVGGVGARGMGRGVGYG